MVFIITETTTKEEIDAWRKQLGKKSKKVPARARKNKAPLDLSKYYGILPNIGDGLEIQKKMRAEWNDDNANAENR
jgi:hypothetical protein